MGLLNTNFAIPDKSGAGLLFPEEVLGPLINICFEIWNTWPRAFYFRGPFISVGRVGPRRVGVIRPTRSEGASGTIGPSWVDLRNRTTL